MGADDNFLMNDELLAEFVDEAREHLDTLESGLLKLEEAASSDPELVSALFRAMHSIKGAAGFMELTAIVDLSHAAENLLSLIRAGDIRPTPDTVEALLQTCDQLSSLLENPRAGDINTIQGTLHLIEAQLPQKAPKASSSTASTDAGKGTSTTAAPLRLPPDDILAKARGRNLFLLHYNLTTLAEQSTLSANEFLHDLASLGAILRYRYSPDDTWQEFGAKTEFSDNAEYCDILLATPLEEDLLEDTTLLSGDDIRPLTADDFILADEEDAPEPVTPPAPQAETTPVPASPTLPAPTSAAAVVPGTADASKGGASPAGGATGRTIRVNVDLMDTLMSLAGELVLVRNQQLTHQDSVDTRMRDNMQRLDVVTSQLQEAIMLTRMQPIGNLFDKIPRIVRDLARKLGKDIQLQLEGNEVELDKIILENLSDPLTHLIRNACDHGIESPETRVASGKPTAGTVLIRAFQEGGQINIEIKDDGGGIDPERIRAKALSKNMRTANELDGMSDKHVINLILEPGFSTAETLSDVSGRGVGMDVVKSSIESLGGSIEITSQVGHGSRMLLRLPLTLAIIPSLVVRSGANRFAIPQVSLEELVAISADGSRGSIEVAHDQEVFRLRDRLLPLLRLSEILERPTQFNEHTRREIVEQYANNRMGTADESIHIAVVKSGSDRFGLIIDEIYGTEEIVVKPMHGSLKRLHCFSGCTIMGDGCVAFILDIDGIGKHADIQFTNLALDATAPAQSERALQTEHSAEDVHDILLFRYGTQEQFAIPLTMIQRIETITADEIQHVGEREFVTRGGVSTYVLRLDKVLSVSSPAKAPETMQLLLCKYIRRPVGILISSIVDTDESRIQFREDSYLEDGLLGSMILRDSITLFLDVFRLVEMAEPAWFATRQQHPPPPQHRRVLLVEDADFFRHVVRRYLEDGGFEVVTAVNGREALIHLNQEEFDLVVSDLMMPEMDGWSLAEEIRRRAQQRKLPLLALSALQNEDDKHRALQCGFDRYVPKFDKESFLSNVLELMTECFPQAHPPVKEEEGVLLT